MFKASKFVRNVHNLPKDHVVMLQRSSAYRDVVSEYFWRSFRWVESCRAILLIKTPTACWHQMKEDRLCIPSHYIFIWNYDYYLQKSMSSMCIASTLIVSFWQKRNLVYTCYFVPFSFRIVGMQCAFQLWVLIPAIDWHQSRALLFAECRQIPEISGA